MLKGLNKYLPLPLSCLMIITLASAETLHQSGTAGSGRATGAGKSLESIIGETVAGEQGHSFAGFPLMPLLPSFIYGDADGSGNIDITDVVFLVSYIFGGGPAPEPMTRGDANCDGIVDVSDAVALIQYIFQGGSAPRRCF